MTRNKFILILALFFLAKNIAAQNCPASIQSQTTNIKLKFVITPGSCGDYPSTIGVDENGTNSTFQLDKCNGSNLDYVFNSGTQPTDPLNVTVDFGGGLICNYVNGTLQVLSVEDQSLASSLVSIRLSNPITRETLIINSDITLNGTLQVFDLKGARIFEDEIVNRRTFQINTVNWSKGTYIIKHQANENSWIKKIAL